LLWVLLLLRLRSFGLRWSGLSLGCGRLLRSACCLSLRRLCWRIASRRLGIGIARLCGLGGLRFVVTLQPEVHRCDFKRHLVARIQRSIELGIQLMYAVIPRISLEPATQRKGGA